VDGVLGRGQWWGGGGGEGGGGGGGGGVTTPATMHGVREGLRQLCTEVCGCVGVWVCVCVVR